MNTEHIMQSVICMLAIDGRIDQQELEFVQQLQQRLGLPSKITQKALHMAKQGKGRVQLSDDPNEKQRIFDVLVHAALADGKVTTKERQVLDAVGTKIGLSKTIIEQSVHYHAQAARADQKAVTDEFQTTAKTSESPPVMTHLPGKTSPSMKTCPKCGFEQEADRTDCLRCGIIFRKFRQPEVSKNDLPAETFPDYPQEEESIGSAAERLEQLQFASFMIRHGVTLGIVILFTAIISFAFLQEGDLPAYGYLAIAGFMLLVLVMAGQFFLLNMAGVLTQGEVVNKWMGRDYNHRRRAWYSSRSGFRRYYHYYLEYTFKAKDDPPEKVRRGRAKVSHSQYSRYRIGAPVKVRYFPGAPWIFRVEIW